jgi:hypothetical protein
VSDQIAWLLMRMHTANERDATDLKKFWATNYRVMLEREPEPGQMWEEVPDTTGKYQRSIEIEDLLVETPDWAYCAGSTDCCCFLLFASVLRLTGWIRIHYWCHCSMR